MGVLTPIKHKTTNGMCVLGSIGLGAGLMYVLDPDRGRRRRAMARDQAVHMVHETGIALDKGLRDLNNRLSGSLIETASLFLPEQAADDVLVRRVRAALGRLVSHPHAIEVQAKNGQLTLSGPVLESDLQRLLTGVRRLRGVAGIKDLLDVHDAPGAVPDLQGRPRSLDEPPAYRVNWTPAARLASGTAGAFLAAYGTLRRGLVGAMYGMVGLSMIARAFMPPQRHIFAAPDELERGLDLQKTLNIEAPVESVFKLLSNPENFPRFMSHVREVKQVGDRAYHWVVNGPPGLMLQWEAEITNLVPNQLLEWKSRSPSMIDNAGTVRFDPLPEGGTRVHIRTSYRPLGGALGCALAEMLNAYPKHVLDEDLARVKSLLEQGKTRAHHHTVTLQEVVTM
jgi:uncharacterized membrane protein/osmotically-inducible protein OsmY